ncbi:D-arabinono-1,4-lactone oxidase [Variovorax dokdonensis]|uniref:D-arabinono-1,4-lactone oxidase n=1 Tax=Variovorax dokdonensis TaxID=344883 RepID=A0ABT7NDQ2_9BURK|nr:D-arabinono-1,4-lactone oxidase [Variovorax dokdonensis]MDM0046080.1 D-arabinono-1,4-lactone oxidase [Variovorax dokdonensis]
MKKSTSAHRDERRAVLKAGTGMAVGAALTGLGLDAAAAPAADAPAGAGAGGSASADRAITVAADARDAWSNWSGIQFCSPQVMATPGSETELADVLADAGGGIRCVGAGHSFTGLVPTDATLISLDRLSKLQSVSATAQTATIQAGIRLAALSRQLDIQGCALRNLPDIDTQSYAGAIATGTHGTGKALPALHADTVGLRIMTSTGQPIECSETDQPDLLAAARVSLGCLGVVTQATVRVVPAYNLHRRVYLLPVQDMLDQAPALADKHRNFEFYYLPHTGFAASIVHDVYEGDDVAQSPSAAEDVLTDLRRLRDWFSWFPSLRRMVAGWAIDADQTEEARNRSWKLLSTQRPTKFNESEFHVPQALGIACVREVIAALEQRADTYFPMELRFVKADDAWLSPFYQRDSCSIAVHAAQGEPYDYLVSQIGPIFRKHEGRPHWGKLHDLSASDLAGLYPRWKDFLSVREQLDPQGRMLNPYTRRLFGLAT